MIRKSVVEVLVTQSSLPSKPRFWMVIGWLTVGKLPQRQSAMGSFDGQMMPSSPVRLGCSFGLLSSGVSTIKSGIKV
ncbi:unnamed protein product [Protopolystoma xenopodis]|uniref:Uncharacterized protein n=1 Tax=Protopolystoma xenopodis TaxID=117903 RepID=A0A448WES3_9PLAT|nr:unnamed protein product [Protopolystoma xenopodis]